MWFELEHPTVLLLPAFRAWQPEASGQWGAEEGEGGRPGTAKGSNNEVRGIEVRLWPGKSEQKQSMDEQIPRG